MNIALELQQAPHPLGLIQPVPAPEAALEHVAEHIWLEGLSVNWLPPHLAGPQSAFAPPTGEHIA